MIEYAEQYLNILNKVWKFDDLSNLYLRARLSEDWKPVKEFDFIKGKFENQRIRIDLNFDNKEILDAFQSCDKGYKIFQEAFECALKKLKKENCNIDYKCFLDNKAVYNKNPTKIKKIFEMVYGKYPYLYKKEFNKEYSKESCSTKIVKIFEKIGEVKTSLKKELQLVISFNPIDWFLSSTAEKWTSCFNLSFEKRNGYKYCLGLPFLAGDKNRVMIYLTDKTKKEFLGLETDSFKTRAWGFLDSNGFINMLKWYPNQIITNEILNKLVGNKFKSGYFFKSKYPVDQLFTKGGYYLGTFMDLGKLEKIGNDLWITFSPERGQQTFDLNLKEINLNYKLDNFNIKHWLEKGLTVDDEIDSSSKLESMCV